MGFRAEDVVQETLLRACRSPDVVDGTHGSVRGWLFTVARHLVVDEWCWTRAATAARRPAGSASRAAR
jgi:RNA polymerase sigma-70 factor (ECF subfamily)